MKKINNLMEKMNSKALDVLLEKTQLKEFNVGDKVKTNEGTSAVVTKVSPKWITVKYTKKDGNINPGDTSDYDPKDLKKESFKEDYEIAKFLHTIRIANNDIQLKDVKVSKTDKGNWYVTWNGRKLLTIDGKLLSDSNARKINNGTAKESLKKEAISQKEKNYNAWEAWFFRQIKQAESKLLKIFPKQGNVVRQLSSEIGDAIQDITDELEFEESFKKESFKEGAEKPAQLLVNVYYVDEDVSDVDEDFGDEFGGSAVTEDKIRRYLSGPYKKYVKVYMKKGEKGTYNNGVFESDSGSDASVPSNKVKILKESFKEAKEQPTYQNVKKYVTNYEKYIPSSLLNRVKKSLEDWMSKEASNKKDRPMNSSSILWGYMNHGNGYKVLDKSLLGDIERHFEGLMKDRFGLDWKKMAGGWFTTGYDIMDPLMYKKGWCERKGRPFTKDIYDTLMKHSEGSAYDTEREKDRKNGGWEIRVYKYGHLIKKYHVKVGNLNDAKKEEQRILKKYTSKESLSSKLNRLVERAELKESEEDELAVVGDKTILLTISSSGKKGVDKQGNKYVLKNNKWMKESFKEAKFKVGDRVRITKGVGKGKKGKISGHRGGNIYEIDYDNGPTLTITDDDKTGLQKESLKEGTDLRCPNCGDNLGKDRENPKNAYCGNCGTSFRNPYGYTESFKEFKIGDMVSYKYPEKDEKNLKGIINDIRNSDNVYVKWNNGDKTSVKMSDLKKESLKEGADNTIGPFKSKQEAEKEEREQSSQSTRVWNDGNEWYVDIWYGESFKKESFKEEFAKLTFSDRETAAQVKGMLKKRGITAVAKTANPAILLMSARDKEKAKQILSGMGMKGLDKQSFKKINPKMEENYFKRLAEKLVTNLEFKDVKKEAIASTLKLAKGAIGKAKQADRSIHENNFLSVWASMIKSDFGGSISKKDFIDNGGNEKVYNYLKKFNIIL